MDQKISPENSSGGGGKGASGQTGGGGDDGDDGCEEERRVATNDCAKSSASNWKIGAGAKPENWKGPYTFEDCMRGQLTERCGGNPVDYNVWKPKRTPKRKR